jgi:hypothetical protein
MKILAKLFFMVVVPGERLFSKETSNNDDFLVVVKIIILEGYKVVVYSYKLFVVGLHFFC